VSFSIPVTKKPDQTRMGKGKGKRVYWEALVKKGMIILEISGFDYIPDVDLLNSLLLLQYRMPIKCKIIKLKY
jgi:large subunit ribosomal protein L16